MPLDLQDHARYDNSFLNDSEWRNRLRRLWMIGDRATPEGAAWACAARRP